MSAPSTLSRLAAPVMEVFASVQGEGLYVGEPQTFLRLRGCPLRCAWCDTPASWALDEDVQARVHVRAAPRREAGWATPFQAACWIAEVEPGSPRTVSVTGGEPLLWPDFVLGLRGVLGSRRLHLETAGAHPRALERVLPACDHVSLDLKLPEDLGAPVELERAPAGGERAPRDADDWARVREACLRLLAGRDAAAKLIVAGGREVDDFEELVLDLARLARALTVIVQPATPVAGVAAPAPELVEGVAELAREHDLAVRVLPQVHRARGVR
jgi:7-carboxy-7-deazaguanine synthase